MKSIFKKLGLSTLSLALVAGLAACDFNKTPDDGGNNNGGGEVDPGNGEGGNTEVNTYEAFSLSEVQTFISADLADVLTSCGSQEQHDPTVWANINTAYQNGLNAIKAATTKAGVTEAFNAAKAAMAECIPLANGLYSYAALSNEERTEILGTLEAYAVRNGITGISLFENGSYVMYNERITLGTETYIPGYGFGTLAEGSINADLESENNADWKRYYHSVNAADPGTANYLDDKGSEVADFYSYFAASFFTTFMNETKDGYTWTPELANELPQAVNLDGNGMATKWRFTVKTGADGLKYSTNSTKADRVEFNNRPVELEDYETAFQFLLNQANGLERGAELAGQTGASAIVGAAAFYDATADGFDPVADAAEWDKVGIKTYVEDGKTYFEYEFKSAVTQFYSMYYITSSLYQPIPQDFIDAVGAEAYCGYNTDKSYTPVDNSLALGSYVLESWETDKQVAYKKNPNYVFAATKYSTPGVLITILPALNTDPNASIKEFLAGNTDSCGIPQEYLSQYQNDPRTRKTTGDSNFKLNVNACDQETWEYLFGVNGVVSQCATEDEYWDLKPALSNPHFVKALSLSIDRKTYADARGSIPSVDYLSSNYMSDPENGISYATTQAHKDAVEPLLRDTDGYGYSLELARLYYKLALEELVEAGLYEKGTKENPTVIELEIAWMYASHEESNHNEIKKFLEDAFNHESVHGGAFKLDVKFWVGDVWSDVYYNKLMKGQYDLGFGSISGNSLNPLDFISVLSSDQIISGAFTLNWGTDTNDAQADILVYNGMRWSYDALWKAANTSVVAKDGEAVSTFSTAYVSSTKNTDGSAEFVFTVNTIEVDGYKTELGDVVIYSYDDTENGTDYYEYSIFQHATMVSDENGVQTWKVVIPAEDCTANNKAAHGIDIYVKTIQGENESTDFFATIGKGFLAE